jgi:D-alanine-D-alanine ligase
MRVLVLYTLAPSSGLARRSVDEFDLSEAARGLAEVLPGARVAAVRGEASEVLSLVGEARPDVVWNACEAPLGRPDREAHVAALLEWLGVRFTGSGSETLALCRRKDRVNAVLAVAGVSVPREGVFPCIVKPADEDGSAGIDADSVCRDREELARSRARWDGPVVVQEFLPGREFAVSMWGGAAPEHASVGEFCFRDGLLLNTYASKWDTQSADFANSPLSYTTAIDPALRQAVLAAAEGAWRAVEARGYLRVDVRLDAEGRPCVLDVNPNPELAPEVGIHRAVTEAGWTWERFVRQQIAWA